MPRAADLRRQAPSQNIRLVFDSLPLPLDETTSSDTMLLDDDDDVVDSERSHAAQASELSWAGIADSDREAKDETKDDDQVLYDYFLSHEKKEESEEASLHPLNFLIKAEYEADGFS